MWRSTNAPPDDDVDSLRRLLLIDENLSPRIASELRKRRRNAHAIVSTPMKGMKDTELLRTIARDHPGAVLVTADDNMPAAHQDVLRETKVSVATINPVREPGFTADEWDREIVHRWVHKMEEQAAGSVRRYSMNGGRPWRPRRRPAG